MNNLSVLVTKDQRTDYLFNPASHNQAGGAFDLHKLIGKLPRPKGGFTLPKHRYCGPYNPLEQQLDVNGNPLPGYEPYNQVDKICLEHDKEYDKATSKKDKHIADEKMLKSLKEMKPTNFREKVDKAIVKTAIGTKYKLGLGLTENQKQTLDSIYYNTKTGYTGINELQRRSKFKKRCERLPSTSRNVYKT